jgi:hypothetical protein
MATNLFGIIEGITVERADIVEAEVFAAQYLSALFPTYDFRQGTAIRDMIVRPNAVMMASIQKAITYYFDESDLNNITDASDADIVDRRLSNFFITRKTGTSAQVVSRLYFSFPTGTPTAVQIPATARFSTDDTLYFTPRANTTVLPPVTTPVTGQFYFEYDNSQDLWYVDITLQSEGQTTEYNLSEGDLLYFTIFSPYFLQGEILYNSQQAIAAETNTEMVGRSYDSISTRNLINDRSIRSLITDQFNYINSVQVFGLGSPYLYRDLIKIENIDPLHPNYGDLIDYHRGGFTDILVDTDPIIQSNQFTTDAAGLINIEGPVISITQSSAPPPGSDPDDVPANTPFTTQISNSTTYTDGVPLVGELDMGLSSKQITQVRFIGQPNAKVTLDAQVFSGLGGVQTWLDGEDNRVVTADYLARAFVPVFIDVNILTHGTPPTDTTDTRTAVETYIASIPNGGTLYASEVIQAIYSSGVTDFVLPLNLTGEKVARDLTTSSTTIVDTYDTIPTEKFYLRNLTIGANE